DVLQPDPAISRTTVSRIKARAAFRHANFPEQARRNMSQHLRYRRLRELQLQMLANLRLRPIQRDVDNGIQLQLRPMGSPGESKPCRHALALPGEFPRPGPLRQEIAQP